MRFSLFLLPLLLFSISTVAAEIPVTSDQQAACEQEWGQEVELRRRWYAEKMAETREYDSRHPSSQHRTPRWQGLLDEWERTKIEMRRAGTIDTSSSPSSLREAVKYQLSQNRPYEACIFRNQLASKTGSQPRGSARLGIAELNGGPQSSRSAATTDSQPRSQSESIPATRNSMEKQPTVAERTSTTQNSSGGTSVYKHPDTGADCVTPVQTRERDSSDLRTQAFQNICSADFALTVTWNNTGKRTATSIYGGSISQPKRAGVYCKISTGECGGFSYEVR